MRSPLRAVLAAAMLAAIAGAQAVRHADVPSFRSSSATFDPARGTVLYRGATGLHELRGNQWHALSVPAPLPGVPIALVAATPQRRLLAFGSNGSALETWACDMATWTQLPVTMPLGYGNFSSIAYDRARNEVVLYGAYDWTNMSLNNTVVFDGVGWAVRPTTVSPPAGTFASMAYDSVRQRVVYVVGVGGPAPGASHTWEWDGVAWAHVPTAVLPQSRRQASMAFDEARACMVLAGGQAAGPLDECWEYAGVSWVARAPLPSGGRYGHSLVHDPVQARTLVIGGQDAGGFECQDVQAWNGTTWSAGPGFGPAPRATAGAAIAVEPGGTGVLLYGGGSPVQWPAHVEETWRWNGTTWTQLAGSAPLLLPSWPIPGGAGLLGAMLWSQQGNMHLLFGYTLRMQGYGVPLYDYPHGMSTWNGTAWSTQLGTALPALRTGGSIAVDTLQNEAVLFGGTGPLPAGGAMGDTWVFDGSNWLPRYSPTSPSARTGAAMAYDPVRDRVVLNGGYGAAGFMHDTWEWDGTNWQQVTTATQPSTGSMIWDAATQRVVLFANWQGFGPPLPPNLPRGWTYDGVDWQPLPIDTTFASPAAMVLGAAGGELMLAVGSRLQRFHRTEAQVSAIGTGCTNDSPLLGTNGWPDLGAASFAVELTYAPPQSVVLLAGSVTQVNVPALGCTLHVDPTQLVVALPTDARGRAGAPLPVPATVTLLGADLFFQGASLSPLAPAGITLTRGLRIRVGR